MDAAKARVVHTSVRTTEVPCLGAAATVGREALAALRLVSYGDWSLAVELVAATSFTKGEKMRHLQALFAAVVFAATLSIVGAARADSNNGPYPHDFNQNNMGYCAPYLAQQRFPDGSLVRPFINHIVQDLTAGDQSWLGYDNFGDFASSKAQSTTDTQCLQRTF